MQDQKDNPSHYRYKIVDLFGSAKEAIARESRLHSKFDVGINRNFYNKVKQTLNGFDSTGFIMSKESREKISIKNLGRKATPECKNKMSRASLGKEKSKTHKENISKGLVGIPHTNERKYNISKSRNGTKLTKEHCASLSKATSGNKNPRHKYVYHTPIGETCSPLGFYPIFSRGMLLNWCIHKTDNIISECTYNRSSYLQSVYPRFEEIVNMTFRELGFYVTTDQTR